MSNENPYRSPDSQQALHSTEANDPSSALARLRAVCALAASGISAALVWALSVALTGHEEPWDANGGFYVLGITFAAFLGGVFAGRRIWYPLIGTYFGQALYCWFVYNPGGVIILPIAIAVAIFGSVPSLFGAVLGGAVHEALRWMRTRKLTSRE